MRHTPCAHHVSMRAAVDPAVESAAPRGWAAWLRTLVLRSPERLAGFGGTIALGFGLSLLLMYGFIWLADQMLDNETKAMDLAATHFAQTFRSPQLDMLAWAISLLGSEAVLAL